MNIAGQYITASPDGSNTTDIVYMLALAVPAAINNYLDNPIFSESINPVGIPEIDGYNICKFIQHNVRYSADSFTEQRIKLPAQLFKTGVGDCKSFSLFFLCAAVCAGYEAGFRFASYSKNKKFTHVYNYIKHNNKIYIFDACVKDLKESPKFTNIKDMKVTYLAGTPSMITDMNDVIAMAQNNAIGRKSKAERKEKRKEKREKKRKEKGGIIKRAIGAGKKVALAGPRGSFILLVDINFRGLARKLAAAREKSPSQYKELWLKLGGDPAKLDKAVQVGLKKKPFLGSKKGINGIYTEDAYIGVVAAATVTTAVTSAAALMVAFNKLFKSLGIKSKKEEGDDAETDELLQDENGENPTISEDGQFVPVDSDGQEAKDYNEQGKFNPSLKKSLGDAQSNIFGFITSPVGMVTTGVGIFLLAKAFSGRSSKN